MLFSLCLLVLIAAVSLGGGTHSGFLGDVAVQLLSIPLLTIAIWPAFSSGSPHRYASRVSLALAGIVLLLVLAQTSALHFAYWRSSDFTSFFDRSAPRKIMTISVSPQRSWAAATSLLAALSVFAGTSLLGHRQRMRLCWAVLGLGVLSLIVGFIQYAQGPNSALRFYEFTNQTEAVGFFANRNHFAALLYITLILAAVWFGTVAERFFSLRITRARTLPWLTAAAGILVAVMAGLALARSRAGLILAIAALGGVVLMMWAGDPPAGSQRTRLWTGKASFAVAAFAVLFTAQFGLGAILTRFEQDPLEDLRIPLARTTADAALQAAPTGTGLGSFVAVYAASEKEADIFAGYVNRAHNDLAEVLLETGLLGAVLLLLFMIWFARRAFRIWISPARERNLSQVYIERAAVLGASLLLVHSLVDYPLRTTALSTIFAFFCAILAFPQASVSKWDSARSPKQKAMKKGRLEGWGSDIVWPENWRRPNGSEQSPT